MKRVHRLRRTLILGLLLVASAGVLIVPPARAEGASAWTRVTTLVDVEYRRGVDEPWRAVRFYRLPHAPDGLEIRILVELPPKPDGASAPLGLQVAAMATCDVSWDGVDLGAGGRVATGPAEGASAEAGLVEEVPGPLQQTLHVPDALTGAGEHLVEMRCTMRHRGFVPTAGFWVVSLGPYDDLIRVGDKGLAFALVSFSGLVLVGLFSLAMWAYDRRRGEADLWLGVFCLAAAGLAVAESWRRLMSYTYDWHLLRLQVITALALLVAVALVVYVVRRFPGPGGGRFIAISGAASLAATLLFQSWDGKATGPFFVALPAAALWSILAVRHGRRGAVAASAGVGLCLVILLVDPLSFLDRHLYVAVDLLLLCLLIGHARERDALRRDEERSRLEAARLEVELLSRQLEPHFLMNTLTALTEWIEEDPPTAVRLIEALAEEMRTLHAIRRRRTITVDEELALCHAHLEVMSLRRDVRYRLDVSGVTGAADIPPAVLHTLVENAITHGAAQSAAGGEVRLTLREEKADGRRVLIFESPLGTSPDPGEIRSGTGGRYVESRLREAYGDAARFTSGARG
ncbi:MAG: histidine kinase, partial [Acidobacteriota bacterium]